MRSFFKVFFAAHCRCALSIVIFCTVACATLPDVNKQQIEFTSRVSGKVLIPTAYEQGLFYLNSLHSSGEPVCLKIGSADWTFMYEKAAERLVLPQLKMTLNKKQVIDIVPLPEFKQASDVPYPLGFIGYMQLRPEVTRPPMDYNVDGMLGLQWLAGRTWTIDYPGRRVVLHTRGRHVSVAPSNLEAQVQFPMVSVSSKHRETNHGLSYVPVEIEGEIYQMLINIGGTVELTRRGIKALDDGRPAIRAMSFMNHSLIKKLHQEHPDWLYVTNSVRFTGGVMIEVPLVNIGHYEIGPVYFVSKPDSLFKDFALHFTDRPLDGALGGNALQYFRVTLDYPKKMVSLERPFYMAR